MTHRSSNAQRGFSLTEVLVAVAVFALIFVAALMVYDRANRIFKTGVDASDVQQTTRVAFERMVADLRMAGFDADRDGFPMGARKYQQPDEQLEFIHPHALTMRTNLNYETAAAADNGRETAYEPGFTTTANPDDDFFPVVTTANNEIVTYFLRSDSGPNDDTITFYADVARPRRTYPDTGGADETLVTITDVDLCQDNAGVLTGCMNPPYTLYRLTLRDDGTPDTPVPIANNIRSISYTYFVDALTQVPVVPNGGIGQYKVLGAGTTAAAITARELRAGVRSIRMNLVGMSPAADRDYVEPLETALPTAQQVAAARNRRQYALQSTIIPRNLGKRGVQEIDVRVPGAPEITRVCTEGCGVTRVEWNAPAVGFVESYVVFYDTIPNGVFNSPDTPAGRNLFAYIDGLDPAQRYHFKVVARNSFGSQPSAAYPAVAGTGIRPVNRTKPAPPTILSVTGDPSGTGPAAVPNDIIVTWRAPNANVGTPMNGCGFAASPPFPVETTRYRVLRSTTTGVAGTEIWSGLTSSTGPAVLDEGSGIVTFTDASPKLACQLYYYTVVGIERCYDDPTWNSSNDINDAISDVSNEMGGQASAVVAPKAPQNVVVTVASTCSSNPCSIFLEWDEVTRDVDDKPIMVRDYTVRRVEHVFGNPGTVETFSVTDPTPGDGMKVTLNDTTAPQPPVGTIYHYTVTATQCPAPGTPVTSAASSPEAKFPCAILTPTLTSATLDGDGSEASPWVIGDNIASISVNSNTDLSTAAYVVTNMSSGVSTAPIPMAMSGLRDANLAYPMPGSDEAFKITMQFTDTLGCASSVIRYVQESATQCCLLPYKDSTGTTILNASVITLGPANNQLTLLLQNQCDDILTLSSVRLNWDIASSPTKNLEGVTWPNGATQLFTPANTSGLVTLTPLAGVPLTIPAATATGPGTYRVILTFSRTHGQGLSQNTVLNFCATYNRPGFGVGTCRVAQVPETFCP